MATALCPGTYDPITLGHLDIIRRGAALFDRVVLAIGARENKRMLLSADERVALATEAVADLPNVSVAAFDGLVVEFAREQEATVLLRGVRNAADYEYERTMALTNERLLPGIETVILVAATEVAFISSSLVKEILHAGGEVDAFVPPHVAAALKARGNLGDA